MSGEVPIPDTPARRHHYTPILVLKHFRRPHSKKLIQLDKSDGSLTELTPKDAAWAEDLYSVHTNAPSYGGVIEAFFGVVENFAGLSVPILLRHASAFTEIDRTNIAFLLAIQEVRAPGFLEEFRAIVTQAATMYLIVELNNVEGPAKKRREARETAEKLTSGEFEIEAPHQEALTLAFRAMADTVGVIFGLPWTLLRAGGGKTFVCSDRPLTMIDRKPPHKFSAAGWQSSPEIVASMPLSSSACLRISPADSRQFHERTVVNQVDRINALTYASASRYVYGSNEEVLNDLHSRALANPDAFVAPPRKRLVVLEDAARSGFGAGERNAALGLDPYVREVKLDGTSRRMAYEVIDGLDDVRRAMTPRPDQSAPREIRDPPSSDRTEEAT